MEKEDKKSPKWLVVAGATLLSAAFFYLSTGLNAIWPSAWFALLPLLWIAYSRQPLWRVAVATFVAFGLGNIGFVRPFIGMHAATIGISMAIVALALVAVLAVSLARFVERRSSWLTTLVAFPALWTGIEYISSLVSPNGTIGSLAYTQARAPVLIQSASLFGMWSITFLICLVANGGALALRNRQKMMPIMAVVVGVFGANLIFGVARLHTSAGSPITRVAVIAKDQPSQRFQSNKAVWVGMTTAYADEVHDIASANPGISTIVLPEKLATLEPQWRNAELTPIAQAAQDNNVRVVAGFEDNTPPGTNIAITFEPNGSSTTYTKRKLLPSENLTPGNKSGLLGNSMAVEICKDMDFPQMIRSDVQNQHIGIVFVPAEDFGDGFDILHARIAAMRGVEDGFSVARAGRRGNLTISDNRGRILAQVHSAQSQFNARIAVVPTSTGKTLYARTGDVFAWACLGLWAACMLYASRHLRTH